MLLAAIIVAAIIGHPAPTTCDLTDGHGGYVDPAGAVHLAPLTCAGLSRYASDRMLALSIFTVAHESQHAKGISDEHQADCAALPLVAPLARRYFHAGPARATRLAAVARAFHASLPPPYAGPC